MIGPSSSSGCRDEDADIACCCRNSGMYIAILSKHGSGKASPRPPQCNPRPLSKTNAKKNGRAQKCDGQNPPPLPSKTKGLRPSDQVPSPNRNPPRKPQDPDALRRPQNMKTTSNNHRLTILPGSPHLADCPVCLEDYLFIFLFVPKTNLPKRKSRGARCD